MAWELVVFAVIGSCLGLWYGLREVLVWRAERVSRRRALASYPWPSWVRR